MSEPEAEVKAPKKRHEKAENTDVMGCDSPDCRVLMFLGGKDSSFIFCPSCRIEGRLLVKAETRHLGQRSYPPMVAEE